MRRLATIFVFAALLGSGSAARADFQSLLDAARGGDIALVREILAADPGSAIAPTYHQSYSPLQFAAGNGNVELTELLIKAGVDTEFRDHNNDRALIWAAERGYAATVRLLLEAGSPPDSDLDPYGQTPLMRAARYAHVDVVRLLLVAGADVHRRDQSSDTALGRAALTDNAEIVRMLLAAGANPNTFDDILLETPLHIAAAWSTPEVIRLLVDAGAAVYARDEAGKTPLLVAASLGYAANVAALIDEYSSVDRASDGGDTPLAAAARSIQSTGDRETTALLLAERTDDLDGGLVAALWHGLPAVALRLLERGASPNAVDRDGTSALAAAVRMPGLTYFTLLLLRGADLERFGPEAMVVAAGNGRTDMVQSLLARGVPIESRDRYGSTPFLLAARGGAVDLVRVLLAAGADPDAVDDFGNGFESYLAVRPALIADEITKRERSRAWRPTEHLELELVDLEAAYAAIRALVAAHKR